MREDQRKCLKCGSSPGQDPATTLYRFPKPGKNNTLRCELWAKYCFPDREWSSPTFQKKLYDEHRMLCHKHFEQASFINYSQKKLHKHASPTDKCDKAVGTGNVSETIEAAPSKPLISTKSTSLPASSSYQLAQSVDQLTVETCRKATSVEMEKENLLEEHNNYSARPVLMNNTKTLPNTSTYGNVQPMKNVEPTEKTCSKATSVAAETHLLEHNYAAPPALMDMNTLPSTGARGDVRPIQNVEGPSTISCNKAISVGTGQVLEEQSYSARPVLMDITNALPGTSACVDDKHIQNVDAPIVKTYKSSKKTQAVPSHGESKSLPSKDHAKRAVKAKKNTENKGHLYIKCRKYMKRVCKLRNKIKLMKNKRSVNVLSNDDSVKMLMKKLTPTFALMLQAQLKNCNKKRHGRRWSMEDKIIALRMYKRSPTCYRLLRRLFTLPAPSTLKSLLSQFHLKPGINEKVFDVLKDYSKQQKPSDNEYVLMFDEMSIKKHLEYNKKEDKIEGFQDHGEHGRTSQEATYALVFMIAGIRKKVKQPVAYYLSSAYVTADRLAVLIKQVLSRCFEAGLSIPAIVCDMDGVNRRALKILGATEDKPYITFDNSREVVTMYDPPHLLKCFRNLFMKYDIKCPTNISSNNEKGKGLAKWSHVVNFYELDNANPNFVFAPCLKKEHLSPNTKQKMKVKLAAQVLSHSVAAGMYAKIAPGELGAEAAVTADMISKMDKLFDAFNSECPDLRRGKPHATNISNTSPHHELFREMKMFFKNIEFMGSARPPPSQQGWIWTINGMERLWSNLKRKHNDIKSLATRRIQQDPLENLFGCIRGNCGANSNPTAVQFVAGLKTAIMSNLSSMSGGNCETDNSVAIINNFKTLLTTPTTDICTATASCSTSAGTAVPPLDSVMLSTIDNSFDESMTENSGEMQACAYVCGFLIKRHQTTCTSCKDILSSEQTNVHSFVSFKEYREIKKSLQYASKQLIECVENCANVINSVVRKEGQKDHLHELCKEKIGQSVNFNFLRSCGSQFKENFNYIESTVFYICIKRYCILKNRQYVEDASTSALNKKIKILKHV